MSTLVEKISAKHFLVILTFQHNPHRYTRTFHRLAATNWQNGCLQINKLASKCLRQWRGFQPYHFELHTGPTAPAPLLVKTAVSSWMKFSFVYCPQIPELYRFFKASVRYLYITILPYILLTRHKHILCSLCAYFYTNLLTTITYSLFFSLWNLGSHILWRFCQICLVYWCTQVLFSNFTTIIITVQVHRPCVQQLNHRTRFLYLCPTVTG
jgi:hypothetical protein